MLCCGECGGLEIVEDRQSGDSICQNCGLVLEEHAWEVNHHDLQAAPLLQTCLPQHIIVNCPQRFIQVGDQSSRIRTLAAATSEIRWMAGQLALTDSITQGAVDAWEEIHSKHVCRGDLRRGMQAACIYNSCKLAGFPRPKQRILAVCAISAPILTKASKLYISVLQPQERDMKMLGNPSDSRNILSACCSMAVPDLVPEEMERFVLAEARKVDEDIQKSGVLEGKTPQTKAAAAVSIAMQRKGLPKRERLWEYVGVSDHTLSRTLALLRHHTTI